MVDLLRLQETLGCDIVTDGELRRDNFYSFVAEKLAGVRLMTLAEMLDVVEDKAGFERLLQTLDVPAYSISSPVCAGKIDRREPLAADDLRFVQAPYRSAGEGHAARALPAHAGHVRPGDDAARSMPTKEALAEDVVALLRAELAELAAEGADFVQFDEPVLTELAFAPGQHAHVHVRGAGGAPGSRGGARAGRVADQPGRRGHSRTCGSACTSAAATGAATKRRCCRGGYQPLAPYLERLNVAQLVLEYATDRAGDLMPFGGKELGLGVVNPRTDAVESSADIRAAVDGRASLLPARPDLPESRLRLRHVLEPADEYLGNGSGEGRRDGRRGTRPSRVACEAWKVRAGARPSCQSTKGDVRTGRTTGGAVGSFSVGRCRSSGCCAQGVVCLAAAGDRRERTTRASGSRP